MGGGGGGERQYNIFWPLISETEIPSIGQGGESLFTSLDWFYFLNWRRNRFYNGWVTVSVKPPYNNRRASVHLQQQTFGELHWCTEGPVPLSTYGCPRMKVASRRSEKIHGSFERFKTSGVWGFRVTSGTLHALTLPSLSLTLSLSASVTFPERPSIKNLRMRPECCTAVLRTP